MEWIKVAEQNPPVKKIILLYDTDYPEPMDRVWSNEFAEAKDVEDFVHSCPNAYWCEFIPPV